LERLIDEPKDILALAVGLLGTLAFISVIFLVPDLGDIALGALIANTAVVIQHFFGKSTPSSPQE
jgi:hypothetical protein